MSLGPRRVEDTRLELTERHFDLALVDVGLPDGSGFEVASALKKIRPSTALIFLTAFGTAEDRIRGLELGAEDYIVKPFHLKELIPSNSEWSQTRHLFIRHAARGRKPTYGWAKPNIHFLKFEATVAGKTYPLTHKETALLKITH